MANISMRPLPTASIIVMCYNLNKYVADAVNSALLQETEYSFEVIVIDDASTDGTKAQLASFPGNPRLRIILHETNRGCVETANEGFSLAQGEFIARLDGDDRYRAHFLIID
jgi:glycosyltransferase involved in cell wall biosynthesis